MMKRGCSAYELVEALVVDLRVHTVMNPGIRFKLHSTDPSIVAGCTSRSLVHGVFCEGVVVKGRVGS